MKDAAREVQEEDGQTTDGKRKKVAPKRATKKQKQPQSHEIPAPQPSEPVQGEASGSKPPEVVTEPAKVEVEVKDPKVPSPRKAPIKKRGQVSAEDLQTHWKTKEPQSSCCIQIFGMCGNLIKHCIAVRIHVWYTICPHVP